MVSWMVSVPAVLRLCGEERSKNITAETPPKLNSKSEFRNPKQIQISKPETHLFHLPGPITKSNNPKAEARTPKQTQMEPESRSELVWNFVLFDDLDLFRI